MTFRHALVTGASSGIGEAIARRLARDGVHVTLAARRKERLDALAADLDASTTTFVRPTDLSDLSECAALHAAAVDALGPVDLLINNAGVQYVEPMVGVSSERSERLFNVDLHAPMRLMNLVVGDLIEREAPGAVVNIASLAALIHTPGMGHYNAAKAALAAASETMRAEVEHLNVHVLTVYPGPVSSQMESAAREAYGDDAPAGILPMGTPDVLADKIHASLMRERPRLVYPASYGALRHTRPFAQWVTERGSATSVRGMLARFTSNDT